MLNIDTPPEVFYSTGICISRTSLDISRPLDISHLLCNLCKKVLIEPKTCSSCFSNFCSPCLAKYLRESPNSTCVCGQIYEAPKDLNKHLMKSLSNILVNCRFASEGCEAKVYYENLLEHEALCEQRKALCIYLDCPEVLKIKDLRAHEQKCMFKVVKCNYCCENQKLGEVKYHEEKCEKRLRMCPGCKTNISNPQFEKHLQACFKKPETCERCGERLTVSKHRQMDCLLVYFERLKTSYNSQIMILKDYVEDLNLKLATMDEMMLFRCRGCFRFGTESILRECEICQDNCYCGECERSMLRRCSKCGKNFCSVCIKFGELDKLCTLCDRHNKEGQGRPRPAPGKKWTAKRSYLGNTESFESSVKGTASETKTQTPA